MGGATKTYAADRYPSEISLGGLGRGNIRDANLTLKGFGHGYPVDVDVMVSHRGENRTVMSDVGGGSLEADDVTLTLEAEAASPMPGNAQLTAGRKPTIADDAQGLGVGRLPAGRARFERARTLRVRRPEPQRPPESVGRRRWPRRWPRRRGRFGGGWSVTIKARVLR